MSNNRSNIGAYITMGMLGVSFVTLKLCGIIDWSWWWVTLPFWIGPLLLVTVITGWLLYKHFEK